jgi:hypothetical protein
MVREKPSSEKKTRIASYPMPPPHIPRPESQPMKSMMRKEFLTIISV